jgi:hypothetical protein
LKSAGVLIYNSTHEPQHSLLDCALAPGFALAVAGPVSIPSWTLCAERQSAPLGRLILVRGLMTPPRQRRKGRASTHSSRAHIGRRPNRRFNWPRHGVRLPTGPHPRRIAMGQQLISAPALNTDGAGAFRFPPSRRQKISPDQGHGFEAQPRPLARSPRAVGDGGAEIAHGRPS